MTTDSEPAASRPSGMTSHLTKGRRKELHARIGQVLEALIRPAIAALSVASPFVRLDSLLGERRLSWIHHCCRPEFPRANRVWEQSRHPWVSLPLTRRQIAWRSRGEDRRRTEAAAADFRPGIQRVPGRGTAARLAEAAALLAKQPFSQHPPARADLPLRDRV
jgi:hypothetical protein